MALTQNREGTALITETIFENRSCTIQELSGSARHRVRRQHRSGERRAAARRRDGDGDGLRASASLVLAGLIAQGKDDDERVYQSIVVRADRGESSRLGARIEARALGPVTPKRETKVSLLNPLSFTP